MGIERRSCLIKFLIVATLVSLCAGCKGSSSGAPAAAEEAVVEEAGTTVRGVAAAGAPMAGFVYVKGANGVVASSKIGVDGSYSLDITGITAPYILCAEGSVKGRGIKLYSAWTTAGTINITPVTDFIIRNALKGSPETAYASWGPDSIMQAAISDAERDVEGQLAPVLDAAGVPTQVDLVRSSFTADGTGLDAALEALDISYRGNTATVRNIYTGTYYRDDITLAGDSAGFPESEAAATQTFMNDALAISALFDSLDGLYRTSVPTAQAMEAWLSAHVADDFLSEGMNREQLLGEWLAGEGPDVGCNLSAAIIQSFTPSEPYTRAYRVGITYSDPEMSDYFVDCVVHDGTRWLWYGDQRWGGFDIRPHATWFVNAYGGNYCTTGFEFGGGDYDGYAYGRGVRSFFVTGPGLPSGGVIFQNNYPDDDFTIYGTSGVYYPISNDSVISTMPDNAEYSINLCSDEAVDLVNNGTASAHILKVYRESIIKRPVLNRELDSSMFASITSLSTHDIADVAFGGVVNVTWTAPENTRSGETAILFYLGSGAQMWIDDDNDDGNTSAALDLRGFSAPDWASIFIRVTDQYDRDFNYSWGLAR